MPGLDLDRVAQIISDKNRGSGYLVRTRMVLTAAHVVAPETRVEVRFVLDSGEARTEPGQVVFHEESVDLAVIRLDEGPEVEPVRYGRIVEPLPVETVGFPRFRLHQKTDNPVFRDTRHARGTATPASWRREGGLEITVDPPAADPDPRRSAWEGMSGAAIWSVGHLIGVVSEHRLRDALNTLTGSRVDRWYTTLQHKRRKRLCGLTGLSPEHSRLTTVTPHVQWLNAYLDIAPLAADEHPQPDLPGRGAGLMASYTPQRLQRIGVRDVLDFRISQGASATGSLLALDGDAVVTAGPGGGKSSLLRALLMDGISRWRDGHPSGEVPVLVRAADLANDHALPTALAAATSAELSRFGLPGPPPNDFFQSPPRPGGRWLVLVDALDEIIDTEARRRVLQTLSSSGAYRFVICTRPLADRELDLLAPSMPQYELEPLDYDQVKKFAERWFVATGTPDPAKMVRSFVAAIDRAGIVDLTRIPLMASMLCQLHLTDPEKPLPSGRSGVFARFIELLSERLYSRGPGGIHIQARTSLERYGPVAVSAAEHTIAHLREVIGELAVRRYHDDSVDAVGFVADHPDLPRPSPVPAALWQDFIGDTLRRTGLLVGADLRFFHHTGLEYLAAQHLAKDEDTHARALRTGLAAVYRRVMAVGYLSVPAPAPETSYLGFLLDARKPPRSARKLLDRMATGRNVQGCEFIADLVRLGTDIPSGTAQKASRTLWRRIHRKYSSADRARAAVALTELDRERGEEVMTEMVTTPDDLSMPQQKFNDTENMLLFSRQATKVYLALKLSERADPRGPALLIAMSRDTYLHPITRAHCGGALADVGHPNARDILYDLAVDSTMTATGRILAARLLGLKLHDGRAAGILIAMARDENLPYFVPARAAFSLARLQDARGSSILLRIARQPDPPDSPKLLKYRRVQAAKFLVKLGDQRAVKVLERLAHDPDLPPIFQRQARNARKRLVSRAYLDMTVEQRVFQDASEFGGRAGRWLALALAPFGELILPFIARRYGHLFNELVDANTDERFGD
jgi:hypothetical protein